MRGRIDERGREGRGRIDDREGRREGVRRREERGGYR